MNYTDWSASKCAPAMLTALHFQYPKQMQNLMPELNLYFLATCDAIKHLTPQKNLRKAVDGAKQYLSGHITDDEFHRLKWSAEAEAFRMSAAKEPEDFEWLLNMVSGIEQIKNLPIEQAHRILENAAYFVDNAICYPTLSSAPFCRRLCLSEFLCADLLREYVDPLMEDWYNF